MLDIELLAGRLVAATAWLGEQPETQRLPVGCCGAGTGAAAALVAAARAPTPIGAILARGGRPDLAETALPEVTAPTLLIVGANDPLVLDLHRAALAELRCEKRLEIVPLASHLFEEPGTLDAVIELAWGWFVAHLGKEAGA